MPSSGTNVGHGHAKHQCGNEPSTLCARLVKDSEQNARGGCRPHLMHGLAARSDKRSSRAGGLGAFALKTTYGGLGKEEKGSRPRDPPRRERGRVRSPCAAEVAPMPRFGAVRALREGKLPGGTFGFFPNGRGQNHAGTAFLGIFLISRTRTHRK